MPRRVFHGTLRFTPRQRVMATLCPVSEGERESPGDKLVVSTHFNLSRPFSGTREGLNRLTTNSSRVNFVEFTCVAAGRLGVDTPATGIPARGPIAAGRR